MSIEQFEARIGKSKVGKADREWFPKWLRRYGATVSGGSGGLIVTRETVIGFLQSLRDGGTPAEL